MNRNKVRNKNRNRNTKVNRNKDKMSRILTETATTLKIDYHMMKEIRSVNSVTNHMIKIKAQYTATQHTSV